MHPAKSKELNRPWMAILAEPKLDTFDIRRYSPVDLADEMTLINQMLLLRIKPEEFDGFAFLSPKKEVLAPNLTLLLDFYDRMSALCATQILRQKTDKLRASVIAHLFLVIQQLYTKNHDLHSIRMILAAFDHPSIFRLRDTWRTFRREKPKFYTALKYLWNILSQHDHWEEYRSWLEEKFIKGGQAKKHPMLLFVGYLLSTMIIDRYRYFQLSIDDHNPTHSEAKASARAHSSLVPFVQSSPRRFKENLIFV